jgi:dCTP deaminase
MIIAKKHLLQHVKSGKIHVLPFDPNLVGVNSIDVRLGNTVKVLQMNAVDHIDPRLPQRYLEIPLSYGGTILYPHQCYLGHTIEEIGSDYFVPIYEGRSSIGRMFMASHITAGFGEIGFKKQWTLEIKVSMPIKVWPGMKIGQVFFVMPSDRSIRYGLNHKAKYADQSGPQESLFYKEVDNV